MGAAARQHGTRATKVVGDEVADDSGDDEADCDLYDHECDDDDGEPGDDDDDDDDDDDLANRVTAVAGRASAELLPDWAAHRLNAGWEKAAGGSTEALISATSASTARTAVASATAREVSCGSSTCCIASVMVRAHASQPARDAGVCAEAVSRTWSTRSAVACASDSASEAASGLLEGPARR